MYNTYYDIPIDIEEILLSEGDVNSLFFLKDLQQRKIFLNSDIDQYVVTDIVRHIMQMNKDDNGLPYEKRRPIILYISSNGGEVDSGFELIDVIMNSKTPVYTVNLGREYSMAFLIGLSGHKRFAMRNSKFLLHDGDNMVFNSGSKAQDQMKFQSRVEDKIKWYVINRSNLTDKEYDDKLRVEWYMFAEEAKEKGFVDYIIGIDCDMDSIIGVSEVDSID